MKFAFSFCSAFRYVSQSPILLPRTPRHPKQHTLEDVYPRCLDAVSADIRASCAQLALDELVSDRLEDLAPTGLVDVAREDENFEARVGG